MKKNITEMLAISKYLYESEFEYFRGSNSTSFFPLISVGVNSWRKALLPQESLFFHLIVRAPDKRGY